MAAALARGRIKFCGITNSADAQAAVSYGADALGFVFYAKSPRHVTRAQASAIIADLPPLVSKVGLFVNADPREVEDTITESGIDVVQFHGDETMRQCRACSLPWIKAIRVRSQEDIERGEEQYPGAAALLLDAYDAQAFGGTGKTFDWSSVPQTISRPVILAGGLTPDNVASAIHSVRPYAVDVSGGIERAKGLKDHDKMQRFIREVTDFDRQL